MNFINIVSDYFQGLSENQQKPKKESDPLIKQYDKLLQKYPYQVFFFKTLLGVKTSLLSSFIYMSISDYGDVFKKAIESKIDFRTGSSSAQTKFKSWEETLPDFPVTEIILSDNYLFQTQEKSNAPLENNAFKLFRVFSNKYKSLTRIIIFTYIIYSDFGCKKNEDDKYSNECKNKARKNLEEQIKGCFSSDVDVHIIPNANEHDRYILTNYFRITMPSINNLFDESNNLIYGKTSTISVKPYLSDIDEFITMKNNILVDFKNRIFKQNQYHKKNNEKKVISTLLGM